MLLAAIRRRVLSDIESGRRDPSDAVTVANNIYGGTGGGGGGGGGSTPGSPFGGGVAASMGPSSPDQDDSDYYVDILRETIPEGGEVDMDGEQRKLAAGGWRKSVHRFKKKRMSE